MLGTSACVTNLCTRHSDCPPSDVCGSAGVCIAAPLPTHDAGTVDASEADATSIALDAPMLDAALTHDANSDAQTSDAGGGATLVDAGLAPPTDATAGI